MNYGFWNFAGDHPGVDIALFICLYFIVAELTTIRVSITYRNKTDRKSGSMDMFPPISPLRPTHLPEPPEEKGVKKAEPRSAKDDRPGEKVSKGGQT